MYVHAFTATTSVLSTDTLRYFIPQAQTKIDASYLAPYILKRPHGKSGWRSWNPGRKPEQHPFFLSRQSLLESQERRRDRSAASSRSRHGSPYPTAGTSTGPSMRPSKRDASSPGPSRTKPGNLDQVSKPKTPSRASTPVTAPAAPVVLTDPSSISSAIQSLSSLITPTEAAATNTALVHPAVSTAALRALRHQS